MIELLKSVLMVIFTAVVSTVVTYYFSTLPAGSDLLEYTTIETRKWDDFLHSGDDVKLTVNNSYVRNLSKKSIFISNSSNKHLENITLHFEIDNPEVNPAFVSVSPPTGYPKDTISLVTKSKGKYIYNIQFLNAMADERAPWSGFEFNFFFLDSALPEIEVIAATKGVKLLPYKIGDISYFEIFILVLKRMWWVFVIYFLISAVFLKLMHTKIKIKEEKVINFISAIKNENRIYTYDEIKSSYKNELRKRISFFEVIQKSFKSKWI